MLHNTVVSLGNVRWLAALVACLAAAAFGAPQGDPDLTLETQSAHSLPASGPDTFWNFVVPASIAKARYVQAIDIRPGDTRAIRYARVYVDRTHSARRHEIAAGQGFPGSDPAIDRPLNEPDEGRFLFWKPGEAPYVEPEGFAWRLDPGDDLILSVALRPTGRVEQVKPAIALYFTEDPQEKFPMLVKLDAGEDFQLPLDADILAVYPEASSSAGSMEAFAMLPNAERRGLIQIPEWDANRQDVYRYQQPVYVPRGSVISVRVQAGEARVWLQVLPKPDAKSVRGDRRMELEEALLRHQLEKDPNDFTAHFQIAELRLARLDLAGALEMVEEAVRLRPGDPEARNLLGQALAALGRNTEAIEQFRAALTARPDLQVARYNLARALVRARKYDEAAAIFQALVRELPRDAQIRDELAELYLREGRSDKAAEMFAQALAIDPNDKIARRNREAPRGEEPPLLPVPARK